MKKNEGKKMGKLADKKMDKKDKGFGKKDCFGK